MKFNSKLNKFDLKFKSFLFKIDKKLYKKVIKYGAFSMGRGELHFQIINLIRRAANEISE